MKRWLYASETVGLADVDIELLLPRMREFLQAGTGSELAPSAGDGSFLLAVPGPALGKELGKQVRCRLGSAHRSDHRLILPLTWRAAPAGALFPVFDGSLEIEALDARRSQITLVGTATPPLGPLGKALDSTVFHAIAERTAARLLRSLRLQLEAAASDRDAADPSAAEGVVVAPGQRTSLLVADVMTGNPLVVDEETSIRTAALLLHHGGITGLPVVDTAGALVGVLSESDLLPHIAAPRWHLGRQAAHERQRRDAKDAGSACTRPARCTAPDAPLAEAAREMLDHDVSRLVVLDGGRITGILTRHDVLGALIRSDESLRQAVESVLASDPHVDAAAAVEGGRVRLQGEVERRSTVDRLPELVREIDGVVEVDTSGLRWHVDDTPPPQPIPLT